MKLARGYQLSPKEELVGRVRSTLVRHLPGLLFAFLWCMVAFLAFFPLLSLGAFGVFACFFLLASGLWYGLKHLLIWKDTYFVITTARVIDVDRFGLFSHEVSELALRDIEDVEIVRRGLLARLVDMGTVRVLSHKSGVFNLELSGVRHPERVKALLLDVQYLVSRTDLHEAGFKQAQIS